MNRQSVELRRVIRSAPVAALGGMLLAAMAATPLIGDTKAMDAPKVTPRREVQGASGRRRWWTASRSRPTSGRPRSRSRRSTRFESASGIVITRGFPPGDRRARRSPAPRRPLVQLRRRERLRLLEQHRRGHRRARGEDGDHHPPGDHAQGERQGPRRAGREARVGDRRRVRPCSRRTRRTSSTRRPGVRIIDRVALLRPTGGTVTFTDNKEGMLGLRVRRALEDPAEKSGEFKDAAGAVTKMTNMDTAGVTGVYTSSEGKKGKDVWGTRGRWTMLAGTVDGKPDHHCDPRSPGQSRSSHLLARARLRPVCRQHARPGGLHRRQAAAQLRAAGRPEPVLPLPRDDLRQRTDPEDMERHYGEWTGALGIREPVRHAQAADSSSGTLKGRLED